MEKGKKTLGLIIGHRTIFPDEIVKNSVNRVINMLKERFEIICLYDEKSGYLPVETREDAIECSKIFKQKSSEIDGILVTLPDFGGERSIVEAIKQSGLNVPVLIHAFPDEKDKMDKQGVFKNRRDAYCGKISVCNNLVQSGIPFTLTSSHVQAPESEEFRRDLDRFDRICQVVKGLTNCRIGAIGVRPSDFATVRYSEKILEHHGISAEPADLLDITGYAEKLEKESTSVQESLNKIKEYAITEGVPEESLYKMAKLLVTLQKWIEEKDLNAIALQCWPTMQEYYGIFPCTIMSMLSQNLLPSACEMDITGAVSMYALQLASEKPAGLVDINNNYGDDPNKFVVFHCGNLPSCFFKDKPKMSLNVMALKTTPEENSYGVCVGRMAAGPVTFLRISTDDTRGRIRSYVAEGYLTDDELDTFGCYGVAEVRNLNRLMKYVTQEGFEHHVAIVQSHVGDILEIAFKYLGYDLYRHD